MTTQAMPTRNVAMSWPFLINAAFAAVTGVAAVAAPGAIGQLTAIPGWLLVPLGVGLLLFAADLLYLVATGRMSRGWSALISLMDFAWVGGTLLVLGVFAHALTAAGALVLGLTGLVVMGFALTQSYLWLVRARG